MRHHSIATLATFSKPNKNKSQIKAKILIKTAILGTFWKI